MKHLLFIIICGGALLLCPIHTRAEPYTFIAWIILVKYAQKVAEVLSDLWLWIWWVTH